MYWKIASLLIFAIFCLWNWYEMKSRARKEDEREAAFWEREAKANTVRRKPIDHLDYIQIPDDFPENVLCDNEEIQNCIKVINSLKTDKILNLTGYSNTDLKMEYGAPNLTELSRYDTNYTSLVTTLQKWADILLDKGYEKEAIEIMEYVVSTKADIGRTYRLLAKHYLETGDEEKYHSLIETAKSLKSMNTKYIVESLQKMA